MRGLIGVDTERWNVKVIPGDASNDTGQADGLRAKLKERGYKRRRTASVANYPAGTEVWVAKRKDATGSAESEDD